MLQQLPQHCLNPPLPGRRFTGLTCDTLVRFADLSGGARVGAHVGVADAVTHSPTGHLGAVNIPVAKRVVRYTGGAIHSASCAIRAGAACDLECLVRARRQEHEGSEAAQWVHSSPVIRLPPLLLIAPKTAAPLTADCAAAVVFFFVAHPDQALLLRCAEGVVRNAPRVVIAALASGATATAHEACFEAYRERVQVNQKQHGRVRDGG